MGVLVAGGLTGLLNQSSAQVIDGSLKFDKLTSHHLSRTPTSSNRKTWTWSSWVKNSVKIGNNPRIFTAGAGGANTLEIAILASGENNELRVLGDVGSSRKLNWTTDREFRDTGWFHLTVVLDTTQALSSDRLKLYFNGVLQGSGASSTYPSLNDDFEVNNNSVHYIGKSGPYTEYFDGSLSQCYFIDGLALGPGYFGFTDPLINTWRPKKFRAEGTTANDGRTWSDGTNLTNITNGAGAFDGDLTGGNYAHATGAGNSGTINFSNLTSVSTLRLYAREDSRESSGKITVNSTDFDFPTTATWVDVSSALSGGLSSITLKNGSYLTALFAIEVDGVVLRNGITTNLDFGTNGFYLPMDNEDDFEKDKSGKGNNWTPENFSGTFNDPDVLKDSPSGAVSGGRAQTGITTTSSAPSNYATMNPLQMSPNRTPTISDGNLSLSLGSGSSEWTNTGCTVTISRSGKWYWEVTWTSIGSGSVARAGVADSNDYEFNRNTASSGLPWLGSGTGTSWSLDVRGYKYNGGTETTGYFSAFVAGDVMGILLDRDNNTITYTKNNVSGGVAHSNVTPDFVTPAFSLHGGTTNSFDVNFGQKPFKYAPPQGHLPLNSASATPETVITRPDHYVGVSLYSGNNGTTQVTTGFQPDFVWLKGRSEVLQHRLVDSVRGQHQLYSNSNAVQGDWDKLNILSNGFTVTNDGNEQNKSGTTYVSWSWKAGGNKNTFNVDDVGYASAADAGFVTGGSNITPTGASVGTKQGFSIVTWDVGSLNGTLSLDTGLTKAPDFVITKVTNHADDWLTFHKDLSSTESLILNGTRAKASNAAYAHTFNSDGTISGLVVPNWWISNKSYVFYSWHDVPGLQKFGSYIGNANADGPFIELGFRPSVIIIKRSDGGTENWTLWDASRNTTNVMGKQLYPNLSAAEADAGTNTSYGILDFVSNGVKIRGSHTSFNSNTHTFIYAAWAEAPVSNLFGGQSNAR